jgi:hypothetical protein
LRCCHAVKALALTATQTEFSEISRKTVKRSQQKFFCWPGSGDGSGLSQSGFTQPMLGTTGGG